MTERTSEPTNVKPPSTHGGRRKCPVCKQLSADLTEHHATVHNNPNAKFVLAGRASTAAAANGQYGPRMQAWLKANGR